jgi:sorting nexin-4
MSGSIERFEDGLGSVERLVGRGKNRVDGELGSGLTRQKLTFADLAADYQDMAAAFQGLGYLESGITDPLNRFAEKMLDFSSLLSHLVRLPVYVTNNRITPRSNRS